MRPHEQAAEFVCFEYGGALDRDTVRVHKGAGMEELPHDPAEVEPGRPGDAPTLGLGKLRHGIPDIEEGAAMPRGQRAEQPEQAPSKRRCR